MKKCVVEQYQNWYQTFIPHNWSTVSVSFYKECKKKNIPWEFFKYQDSNNMGRLLFSKQMLDLFESKLLPEVKRDYKLSQDYTSRFVNNFFDGSTVIINDGTGNDYFSYEAFEC